MKNMRYILYSLLLLTELKANYRFPIDSDQTFVNATFFNKELIFEVMTYNLGAVKYVEGDKVYLKAERIIPSDEGMLLIGDDHTLILLPKLYSDPLGCYIREQ